MTRLPVRLLLLAVCLAAIGSAAYLTWSFEQRIRHDDSRARRFDTIARVAGIAVADLRAAQESYVAVGQGEDFWFARVLAIRKDLDEKLTELKSLATAPAAATALDDAAGALQDFVQMDLRARDHVRSGQLALASDMVFGDGFDLTKKTGEAVESAVTAELIARDATVADTRRQQAQLLAGAAAVTVLGLLLLVPSARRREATAAAVEARPAPDVSEHTLSDLHDFGVVAVAKVPERAAAAVNLDDMASLCGDLAKVTDTRALPALIERAADLLGASGVVLWIADPDGRELSPIVVHGYPPQLANRLGNLARDAENVTASAYRTGLLQTMKGDAISNGAVAAPLVSTAGCVGVMAAEMKDGGEQQEGLLAAATIIAAQIATLVGPPAVKVKAEATG
jgi:hypothetical protein